MVHVRECLRCRWVLIVLPLVLLTTFGCGSSPTSPSGDDFQQGNTLTGSFASSGGQGSALTAYPQSTYDGMSVYVKEDPTIQTEVASNGSFTLRGLPDGQFTLVFSQNGMTVGEIPFEGVLPNSEITIVVEMTRSQVRLVSQRRTGIGHGDVEIEGLIDEVSGQGHDGTLMVNGYTVLARGGVTAIREGNRARTMEDLRIRSRVHVKGVWESSSVVAHEILLQNDTTPPDDDTSGTCPNGGKVGQKIVLEGTVLSGDTSSFRMRAEGRTEGIEVAFDGTPSCVGQSGKSGNCSVGPGDKVNVKGTLESCSHVQADEVKIQKKGGS